MPSPSPTPYNRTFSFTDFQGSNPSSPLPGSQVDNELENVEQSLNGAIDAINDVRRSDGKLKNEIVTIDALSPQVRAGVGQGALDARDTALAAQAAAEDARDAAGALAGAASGSSIDAATSAVHANDALEDALSAADDAATMKNGADTARDFAAQWASAAEGVDVDDGVNPVNKSAYHWAKVAEGAATGALPDGSVTRAKLAEEVTDELDGKANTVNVADALADKADAATAVTLSGAQTLTDKTLTSPVLNTPTLILKQSSTPMPTAEGEMQWDTDDNALVVGDGAGQRIIRPNAWEYVGGVDFDTPVSFAAFNNLGAFRRVRITGSLVPSSSEFPRLQLSDSNGSTWYSGGHAVR